MAKKTKQENKKKKPSKKKNSDYKLDISEEFKDLMSIISGEKALEQQKENLEKVKKEAISKQKKFIRDGIASGRIVLDSDNPRKVVQKIKMFSWQAPIRKKYVFSKRSMLIIALVSSLLLIYLAILGKYDLMAVVVSLLFLVYVGSVFKPVEVTHTITTKGIETLGKHYDWEVLYAFYFMKRDDEYFLLVDTFLKYPQRLVMLITKDDLIPVFLLLQEHLLYKDIKKVGLTDRLSFGEYIPLEDL